MSRRLWLLCISISFLNVDTGDDLMMMQFLLASILLFCFLFKNQNEIYLLYLIFFICSYINASLVICISFLWIFKKTEFSITRFARTCTFTNIILDPNGYEYVNVVGLLGVCVRWECKKGRTTHYRNRIEKKYMQACMYSLCFLRAACCLYFTEQYKKSLASICLRLLQPRTKRKRIALPNTHVNWNSKNLYHHIKATKK